jgi:hypothetical protein
MKSRSMLIGVCLTGILAVLSVGGKKIAQDRGAISVPGGLGFADFQGYESWEVISVSLKNGALAAIVGNPIAIEAYKSGIPENGKPFPDGAKMAKFHWIPKTNLREPSQPLVPNTLHDVDFMMKDAKRFPDGGGWGYAFFLYDSVSGSFRPGTLTDMPPQGHDAKCGVACHTVAQKRDYVFTQYARR